jgi:MFS family permease
MSRTTFRALRHRDCRLLLGSQLVSLVGTWMQTIAQGWLVYRLTQQPAMLGAVTFTALAPAFLLSPIAGLVVDRMDTRRLAAWTQSGLLLQAAVLGILTVTGIVTIPAIFALAGVMGIINAFDLPTGRVLVTRTVPKEDLPNAIALVSAIFHASRIVGPSIAGFVVAWSGEGWCFLINAFSYLAALAGLAAMRLPAAAPLQAMDSLRGHLWEGFAYLRQNRTVTQLFLLLAAVCLLAFPYTTLLPAFAKDVLSTDARGLGWVMAASGVGATLGAVLLAAKKDTAGLTRTMLAATFALGILLVGFSFTRSVGLSSLLIIPVAWAMVTHMTSNNTLVQMTIPEALRGRVMALHGMVFLGAVPLGSLFGGLIAAQLGVPVALALGGAGCSVAAILSAWALRRNRSAEP